MSAPDGGGPAFPQGVDHGTSVAGFPIVTNTGGMTLRDFFASQAMVACIECHQRGFIKGVGPTKIAATSYEMADAMLKARSE